jgi:hypothetical protein
MSGPLAAWALKHTAAPNQTTRLVLVGLALRAHHDGSGANLTREDLRDAAGLGKGSDTPVKRALRWLRDNHEVDEPHGSKGGKGKATIRRVLIRWCQGPCWSCEVLAEEVRKDQAKRGGAGLDPLKGGSQRPPLSSKRGSQRPPLSRRAHAKGAHRSPKGGSQEPPLRNVSENPTHPEELSSPRAARAASVENPSTQHRQPRRARLVDPQLLRAADVAAIAGGRPTPPPTADQRRWREELDKRAAAERLVSGEE